MVVAWDKAGGFRGREPLLAERERGIALAFVPPDLEEGARLAIDVRGEAVDATMVPTPFVGGR